MKRKLLMAASAVLLVITFSYSNYFLTGLHYGDYTTVLDNPAIRRLANVPRFFFDASTSATQPGDYAYRPMVTTSFAVDYFLGKGVKPFLFHLSTFLTYLAGLALVAWLFYSVFEHAIPHPWNPYLAVMGTALLGLHPAAAELLNPISQRGELYAALGVVGGVALFAGLPRQRRFFLYLVPPFLGVLANPAGLIFGPMLLAYILLVESVDPDAVETLTPDQTRSRDLTQPTVEQLPAGSGPKRIRIRRRKHPFRRYIKTQMERFMPALVFTGVAGMLHSVVTPFQSSGDAVTSYWFTQPWVALRYFRSFFVPTHLSPSSDLTAFSYYDIHAVLGLAFVVGLLSLALIVAISPQWRPAVFGIWWFLLALLPGAMLMQPDVEKDTRMFLPFVGLALSVTWAGRILLPSGEPLRRLEAIVATAVLLALAYGTFTRNQVWSSEETLWRDNVTKNPGSIRGLQNYALVLASKGRTAEGFAYLQQARHINPKSGDVEANMGTLAAALHRDIEAEEHFRLAQSLAADRQVGHYPYALWLEKQLDKHAWNDQSEERRLRGKTLEAYSWAASLAPSDLRPLYGMMRLYSSFTDWNSLATVVDKARKLAPGEPDIEAFATMVRNHPDSVKDAEQLVKDHPSPENYLTLSDAYWRVGEFTKCKDAAQKALDLRPGFAEAYNNIGVAYISLGRLDEAIDTVKTALRFDPDNKTAKANLIDWEREKLVVGGSIMRK